MPIMKLKIQLLVVAALTLAILSSYPFAGNHTKRHALAATTQREDFGRHQPGDWTPRKAIHDVVEHDKGVLTICPRHDRHARLSECAYDPEENGHCEPSENEKWLSSPSIGQPPGSHCCSCIRNGVRGSVE